MSVRDHTYISSVRVELAMCPIKQGRGAEAGPILERAMPGLRDAPDLAETRGRAEGMLAELR